MNSSISSSDSAEAYDRLHPKVQQWIRGQGWSQLRPVQVAAANAILDGEGDVLISASTAAGKTEAAFLPILTLVAEREQPGLSVLYVSPLKALINDQFSRLGLLCEHLELPIVRWHGDASQSAKSRMTKDPRGIALITPESIEAMFVAARRRRQSSSAPSISSSSTRCMPSCRGRVASIYRRCSNGLTRPRSNAPAASACRRRSAISTSPRDGYARRSLPR